MPPTAPVTNQTGADMTGADTTGADRTGADTSATTDPRALVDDPRRHVRLDAMFNFRDLGGYPLADGRVIRWGRLFRADGLQRATDADLDVFDALGIRTVIDLRSSTELDERGRFRVERHPVDFHHLPVLDATWQRSDVPDVTDDEPGSIEFLTWAYRQMLDSGADQFAHAIRVLVVPESTPAVFHCAAGKDRTGVLAALVLAGLGVSDDVVIADYALSGPAMARTHAWVSEHHPEMLGQMGETPAFMLAAHPEAMRRTLDDLRARHGSVAGYLGTIGIGPATLAALGDALTA